MAGNLSSPRDYYADLGISKDATADDIKAAFHGLARQHHPDKQNPPRDGDAAEFRKVREAYEKLSDVNFRRDYDRAFWKKEETKKTTEENFRTTTKTTFTSSYTSYASGTWSSKSSPGKQPSSTQSHNRTASSPHLSTYPMAHGLHAIMTNHPAAALNCPLKPDEWIKPAGSESCIFCLRRCMGGFRCPGCQAFACPPCMMEMRDLGKKPYKPYRPRSWVQYSESGEND